MNLERLLLETKTSTYDDFAFDLYSNVGEVNENDLYSRNGVSFYIVQEFRWISLLAAQEFPALIPGIVTCIPIFISTEHEDYLLHLFWADSLDNCLENLPIVRKIETFAKKRIRKVADKVQRDQQINVAAKVGAIATSHRIPSFKNLILNKNRLSFFNSRNQLVHEYFLNK